MLDALAFDAAYRAHHRAMVRAAEFITDGSPDHEDMAQEAWIELWKMRARVRIGSLKALLRTLIRHAWWRRLNRTSYKHDASWVDVEEAFGIEASGGQENAVEAAQVEWAVADLPEAQSVAVSETLMGKTPTEIMGHTGSGESTITTNLRRGIANLKRWFEGGTRPSGFPLSPRDVEAAKAAWIAGESVASLARRYGTSRLTIDKALSQ